MTRENKVGLAVCGSFVCLVGAVAFLKLHEPPASAVSAPNSPTLAVAGPGAAPGDKGDPPTDKSPPPSDPAPTAAPPPPGPTLPPPAATPNVPPDAPNLPVPGPVTPAAAVAGNTDITSPADDRFPPFVGPPYQPDPAGLPPPPPGPPALPPVNPTADATPPPPLPPPVTTPDPAPPSLPPPLPPPAPPGPPSSDMGIGTTLAPPASDHPQAKSPKSDVVVPAAPPAPPPPPPPPTADLPAAPMPLPPVNVAPPKNDPPTATNINLAPTPAAPKSAHEIAIPATVAPAAPGTPLVDSWDEKIHVWAKGDTFDSVSQSAYGSADYGAALQMYNRSHPRAGSSLRQKGTVAEGDKIYIPDQRILEKRHADAIAKPKPRTDGAGAGLAPAAPIQAGFQQPSLNFPGPGVVPAPLPHP